MGFSKFLHLDGRHAMHIFLFVLLQITMHTNCVFEVKSIEATVRRRPQGVHGKNSPSMSYSGDPPPLRLKGQMEPLSSKNDYMIFLCSPVLVADKVVRIYIM